MFVVASGYDCLQVERVASRIAAHETALALGNEGHALVSIWDDADYDSRLSAGEPLEQFELLRPRSAKLARKLMVFGDTKTPVARSGSRAASWADRGRKGER